nr:hypothetical protein GCM10025699_36740 [Microbacterium flavescens]
MNYNLFEGRMMTLPVFAYTQYMNAGIPVQAYHDRAWAAALVLIVIVMLLNLVARLVAKIYSPSSAADGPRTESKPEESCPRASKSTI